MSINRDTALEPDEPKTYATGSEPEIPISLLSADEPEAEWLELNARVNWLRHTYVSTAAVTPRPGTGAPPRLALRLRPRPERLRPIGMAPRLRRGQAAAPRLGDPLRHPPRPRPTTRQTAWPGEDPGDPVDDRHIPNRDEDFVQFVLDNLAPGIGEKSD